MLSDPGSVDKSKPILLSLDLSMLPSAIARASATPSQIYEAQSLRLLPTACLFLCLRITHVVTYTSPKLDPGCGGYRFPERTFTSGYISASWRTAIAVSDRYATIFIVSIRCFLGVANRLNRSSSGNWLMGIWRSIALRCSLADSSSNSRA